LTNLSQKEHKMEMESLSSAMEGKGSSAVERYSGVITPPPSEAGSRCPSTDFSSLAGYDVNNTDATQNPFPQSPPTPPTKSRRDLKREANRSQKFITTRLRSSTNGSEESDAPLGREGRRRKFKPQRNGLPLQNQTKEALKAVEPLHDPVLTKMAFAEQQKWITVQQKTFTKWYVA
jgi:hypothetical protein